MRLEKSISDLKRLHREGRLCVYVGAGISKSCGLPNWTTLSLRVIDEAWPDTGQGFDVFSKSERSTRAKYSPLDAMRMARRKLGQQFNSVVSKCLYSEAANLSSTVESIVSLRNVRRIICSNYDDLLEEGYTKLGVRHCPLVQGDSVPLESDDVLIFHPHGFLPRSTYPRDYSKDPIILSEDDYHELYAAPYSWSNVIQLNLLISFNMLFVGCSLKDPNLRRLLDISKKVRVPHHFAIMRNPDFQLDEGKASADQRNRPQWWKELISFQKHVETENLKERGITAIWYEEDLEVSKRLREIA